MRICQSLQRIWFLAGKAVDYTRRYGILFTAKKIYRKIRFAFYKPEMLRNPLFTQEELDRQRSNVFPRKVTFSILVPLYNTPENFLREMIESVQAQTYGDWELCLADGSTSKFDYVETICREYAAADTRIVYRRLEKNMGISGNTNACLEFATGEYIALFDHDDVLHPAALHQMMEAICTQGADYIYTDEAVFVGSLNHITTVHCKSNFSVDNLRANNYICHFSAFSREVLEKTGQFRKEYDGSQDHDFILRATENAEKIVHIPQILYYWRSHPNSVAQDISSKSYAIDAGVRAVRDSLARRGIQAKVESSEIFPAIYRIHYPLEEEPLVSIVVAITEPKQARVCLEAVMEQTSYPSAELILTGSAKNLNAVAIPSGKLPVRMAAVENAGEAELRNVGAQAASGKYVVFLTERTMKINPDWIQELLMYAQRSDAGFVGGLSVDRWENVVNAGLVLHYGQEFIGSPFRGVTSHEDGYMGRLFYSQTYSALSEECLMVSKALFTQLGGFRTELGNLAAPDICLRSGKPALWTPYAVVSCELKGKHETTKEQRELFRQTWSMLTEDPWYADCANKYLEYFFGNGGMCQV